MEDNLQQECINVGRRRFLIALTTMMGGIGVAAASIPFLSSMLPSARAEAEGGPIEVDVSNLQPGEQMTVEWRGQPVWIIRRTTDDLARLRTLDDRLRDPTSLVDQQPPTIQNYFRSLKPEYLVIVGLCTHLGCAPLYRPYFNELGSDWPGGFLCPCHGSKFDMAGRVFKGVPAPINLQVPPYRYKNDYTIVIGEDNTRTEA